MALGIAKAITEKLLHALPQIEQIYLLIRSRSLEHAETRAKSEIFGSSLFAHLRQAHPGKFEDFWKSKVTCLSGDIRLTDLGLASDTAENIDVIINCAAAVTFRERLDTALETNVLGVANLLEFAKAADAIFVQASTAYVNGQTEGDAQ